MQELIRHSMRLWQRAREPEAGLDDLERALWVIPGLCSALDGACGRPGRRDECELEHFSSRLAHEVRNRINLLEMSLQRAELLGESQTRALLYPARQALRRLAAVVDELRPGAPAEKRSTLPFNALVEDLLAATRPLADKRGISLEVVTELPAGPVDVARLELILVNLLSNALDHADEAEERCWIRIAVDPVAEEDAWRVTVADNGVGIPDDLKPHVFEESVSGSDDGTGSGLGLVLARQAIEREGGRIWLESEWGQGTRVSFTLPRNGSDEAVD